MPMVTLEEISTVPLLEGVPPEAMAALINGAADLRLIPGEKAVHEGDPPALGAGGTDGGDNAGFDSDVLNLETAS